VQFVIEDFQYEQVYNTVWKQPVTDRLQNCAVIQQKSTVNASARTVSSGIKTVLRMDFNGYGWVCAIR
jgi:hypothetical protein